MPALGVPAAGGFFRWTLDGDGMPEAGALGSCADVSKPDTYTCRMETASVASRSVAESLHGDRYPLAGCVYRVGCERSGGKRRTFAVVARGLPMASTAKVRSDKARRHVFTGLCTVISWRRSSGVMEVPWRVWNPRAHVCARGCPCP